MTSSLVRPKSFLQVTPEDLIGVDMGVTGPRTGMTARQAKFFESVLQEKPPTRFHHGDCRGVDEICYTLVRYAVPVAIVVGHPPVDDKYRAFCKNDFDRPPKDYLVRNQELVSEINFLVAFPDKTEVLRSGTWSTIRYARKRAITIAICYPNGSVVWENGP